MNFKKLFAIVLAAAICLGSVFALPAYAEEVNDATLAEVKILYVPLKSKIAYAGFTDLSNIILELRFSDGSKQNETVYFNGENYKAGKYNVFYEFFFTDAVGQISNYGKRTAPLTVTDGSEHAETSLTVFSIPSPAELFAIMKNYFETVFDFGDSDNGDNSIDIDDIKYISYPIEKQNTLITSYDEFKDIFGENADNHPEYNRQYFKKHNLAFVMFELPDTSFNIKVESAVENGATLEVKCKIVYRAYTEGLNMICHKGILIEADKSITKLNVDSETVIELSESDSYFRKEGYTLISSYDEFTRIFGEKAEQYPEYNEEFFKNRNLAFLVFALPNPSYKPTVESYTENGDTLEVNAIITHDMSGVWVQIVCYESILIETSKNIAKIDVETKEVNINSPDSEDFVSA